MASIIIVEDDLLISKQLKAIVESFGHQVLQTLSNGDQAIDILGKVHADLFLLDINIEGTHSGIEVARCINRSIQKPFIFITSYSDKGTIDVAKQVMPSGYVIKPFDEDDIYTAVEIALFTFGQKMTSVRTKSELEQKHDVLLTPREYQTLLHLSEGLTNAQIAAIEYVSINTVKTHLRSLYGKFDVRDRLKLVHTVMQNL